MVDLFIDALNECIRKWKYVCIFEPKSLGKDFNVGNIVEIKNMDTRKVSTNAYNDQTSPSPNFTQATRLRDKRKHMKEEHMVYVSLVIVILLMGIRVARKECLT